MSLRSLNRMRKSIAFRLTIWYSILFPMSSILFFGLIYFQFSSYINRKDRETIDAKLEEYADLYVSGGIGAMADEIRLENRINKRITFYVRVVGPQNKTIFESVPKPWEAFNYKSVAQQSTFARWIHLMSGKKREIAELRSKHLPDGVVLQIGKSIKNREILLARIRDIFASIMSPVILLGFVGGALLSFKALKPIHSLIQTVGSIDTTKMNVRVPESRTGDELEELTVLFNSMLEKIEALFNGMQNCLDNLAHDLRTPITRLRGIAEMALQEDEGREYLCECLMDCAEESENILTLVNTLMDISEAETGVMRLKVETADLFSLCHAAADLYKHVAEDKNIAVLTDCPEDLTLRGDSNRIRQVLVNLLDNAIKYTPPGGSVNLIARRRGNEIVISVKDNGEGIAAEEIPKIWERLYRVDKSRSCRGLGLGLSLVKAIVQTHGGTVEVFSTPGKGSEFLLRFPATIPTA
jgi:signal transduction histidine kinase